MPRVIAVFDITPEEFAEGWGSDGVELTASVRARLEAVIDDNGNEATPRNLDIAVRMYE